MRYARGWGEPVTPPARRHSEMNATSRSISTASNSIDTSQSSSSSASPPLPPPSSPPPPRPLARPCSLLLPAVTNFPASLTASNIALRAAFKSLLALPLSLGSVVAAIPGAVMHSDNTFRLRMSRACTALVAFAALPASLCASSIGHLRASTCRLQMSKPYQKAYARDGSESLRREYCTYVMRVL